uniref:Uncharacterized protein n=1 Tax=Dunaliella tertiolecta TaxID=3047 RepID=A0A7S3QW47_DUNTE
MTSEQLSLPQHNQQLQQQQQQQHHQQQQQTPHAVLYPVSGEQGAAVATSNATQLNTSQFPPEQVQQKQHEQLQSISGGDIAAKPLAPAVVLSNPQGRLHQPLGQPPLPSTPLHQPPLPQQQQQQQQAHGLDQQYLQQWLQQQQQQGLPTQTPLEGVQAGTAQAQPTPLHPHPHPQPLPLNAGMQSIPLSQSPSHTASSRQGNAPSQPLPPPPLSASRQGSVLTQPPPPPPPPSTGPAAPKPGDKLVVADPAKLALLFG